MSPRDGEDAAKDGSSKPAEGLSQFIGKVLDQLSLTAWMPAVMLVGAGALLLQLHAQQGIDIALAVYQLSSKPLGTIIVLIFAVILAAVLTQAFSFEAIRLLEGYWGDTMLSVLFLHLRVNRHSKRRKKLQERLNRQRQAAFESARVNMWNAKAKPAYIEVLEDDFYDVSDEDRRPHADVIIETARRIGWRSKSSPAMLDAIDRTRKQFHEYPKPHRVLPTKLGNVMRSIEDTLADDEHELEGFIMRRYAIIPSRLMTQHDQFRNRLEMYCTLVPIFGILAASSVALLARKQEYHHLGAIGSATLFILLGIVSYQAAIASARTYGTTLMIIAELPDESGQ